MARANATIAGLPQYAAADIESNAVVAAKISAGTITNAKLSSPESYFQQSIRLGKVPANAAAASRGFMGRLPGAATLVKVLASASGINNVALTTPPCCVWISNGTNRLLSGSGVTVPSTAQAARSGTVQSTAQAANAGIWAVAKSSTTTSGLGVNVVAVWKINHTT